MSDNMDGRHVIRHSHGSGLHDHRLVGGHADDAEQAARDEWERDVAAKANRVLFVAREASEAYHRAKLHPGTLDDCDRSSCSRRRAALSTTPSQDPPETT